MHLLKRLRCWLGHKMPPAGNIYIKGDTIAVLLCSRCAVCVTFERSQVTAQQFHPTSKEWLS